MKFPRLGVNILQHQIFTPVHLSRYIMALHFHLLMRSKNIIALNFDPIPQGENIKYSLLPRGENIIPLNVYPFHGMRMFCCQIFTPCHGMMMLKYETFTPFV